MVVPGRGGRERHHVFELGHAHGRHNRRHTRRPRNSPMVDGAVEAESVGFVALDKRPEHSSAPHAYTSTSGFHEGSVATARHRLHTRARVRSIEKGSSEKTCCSTSWSSAASPPRRKGMNTGTPADEHASLPAGSQTVCCTRCRIRRDE
eukprot:scaffold284112_cov28-Tisochrysis_lutea.AAC.6